MEDLHLQIKSESTQLCKMLLKPDSQRMPFQGVQIAKSLQRINFFSKFFDVKSEQFVSLCINSHVIEYRKNQNIYEREQTMNIRYVYVILEGSVKIKQKRFNREIKNLKINQSSGLDENVDIFTMHSQKMVNQTNEQLGCYTLNTFGLFGQTEILFSQFSNTRNQVVTTESQILKCMVIQQGKILNILNFQAQMFIQKAFNYLLINEYFENLNQFQKQQLISHINIEKFKKADILLKQTHRNEKQQSLVFIIHGSASVVCQMPKCRRLINKPIKYSLSLEDQALQMVIPYQSLQFTVESDIPNLINQTETYKIDQITQMESFGEYECINGYKAKCMLVGNGSGSYYTLNYPAIKQTNHPILKDIKENALPYPDEQQIEFLFKIKNELTAEKNKVEKKYKFPNC